MLNISYLLIFSFKKNFLVCLLLTVFRQDWPTGSEIRSTDFAWNNEFSVFSVAGRPVRSTAVAVSALGFSGSTAPVDRSELQSSRVFWVDRPGRPLWVTELSGFVGRPTRSTVRRISALICLFIHCSSHLSLTSPATISFPLFSKNFQLSKSLKFLQKPSWIHSLWVRSSLSGLSHQQISLISRSRVWVSHFQVKISSFV